MNGLRWIKEFQAFKMEKLRNLKPLPKIRFLIKQGRAEGELRRALPPLGKRGGRREKKKMLRLKKLQIFKWNESKISPAALDWVFSGELIRNIFAKFRLRRYGSKGNFLQKLHPKYSIWSDAMQWKMLPPQQNSGPSLL